MQIKCNEKDTYVVIYISGMIKRDSDNINNFQGLIHRYMNANKRNFIVDLTKADWIDSIGLGMLISASQNVKKEEGQFKIVFPPPETPQHVNHPNFAKILDLYRTLEEAVKSLDGPIKS